VAKSALHPAMPSATRVHTVTRSVGRRPSAGAGMANGSRRLTSDGNETLPAFCLFVAAVGTAVELSVFEPVAVAGGG
jgi:hypothetical protein